MYCNYARTFGTLELVIALGTRQPCFTVHFKNILTTISKIICQNLNPYEKS